MKLRRAELKKARIEIIPMIDTIFFLLVFFIMTSLAKIQMASHQVQLPTSATANEKPRDKVVVSVSKDGKFYVDRQEVQELEILPVLGDRLKKDPGASVVINCDRQQHVAEFIRIFDLVKQANAAEVMIATTPRDPKGQKS